MNNQYIFREEPFELPAESDETDEPQLGVRSPMPRMQGNQRDQMRWVQRSLNKIMGLRLAEDGLPGPLTRSAIRSFQQKHGLVPDGIVGPATKQAIIAASRAGMPVNGKNGGRMRLPGTGAMNLESETGVEVALGAAALGVAIFQVYSQTKDSSISMTADVARYVHENTPAYVQFSRKTIEFLVTAHHPRYGISNPKFYFRLTYEYNRYDLRNVSISFLRDKSTSLDISSFSIQFRAAPYSQPTEPMARIIYNIQGRWDPVGSGDVNFEGSLQINADGSANGDIRSEENWVKFTGFLPDTRTITPVPLPPNTGIVPPSSVGTPTLRYGARGPAVTDLQIRLNRWLTSQGRQLLIVDGDFGPKTKTAVVGFQQAAGLSPDGVVGPKTWSVLRSNW